MSAIMNPARPTYAMKEIGQLRGYQNGRLDERVLVRTTARGLTMCAVSARKFNALQGLAIQANISLTSTGDYRTYQQQINLMLSRYDRGFYPGRADYNSWNGITYSLKLGLSMAATPGTSNHGWGRSRDFAEMTNGDTIPDSLRTSTRNWLATMAPKCGIYFPVSSEDWHGEDYAGDDFSLCQTVLQYEGGHMGPVIEPFIPGWGMFSLYPLNPYKDTIYLKTPNLNSDLVAYLQGVLKVKLGYGILVDHEFGPRTKEFVMWFQGTHHLTIDGVVGPKTWAVIDGYAK